MGSVPLRGDAHFAAKVASGRNTPAVYVPDAEPPVPAFPRELPPPPHADNPRSVASDVTSRLALNRRVVIVPILGLPPNYVAACVQASVPTRIFVSSSDFSRRQLAANV